MKKFFNFLSIIIYMILIAILYKNYSISNKDYYLNYTKINSIFIAILLLVKITLDVLSFLKKESKHIEKISIIYIFIILVIGMLFIPKAENESKLLNKNLKAMLELNKIVFSGFNIKENKLPKDKFFKKLNELDLGDTIYLKKGNKKYKYKIKVIYDDFPKLKAENSAPGTFFIVVSKKHKDFYITATILDPVNKKLAMLSINGEIIVLNKNINLEEIYKRKRQIEFTKKLYMNLKYK